MDLDSLLNPEQLLAVRHADGPLLVVAGAGSGKTRVLTYRFAHLVRDRGADPRRILAVTFTNKAAREMSDRIARAIDRGDGRLAVGTFHSFGARFLRREAEAAGLDPGFGIYDAEDQERIVSEVMKELSIPTETWSAGALRARISDLKERLLLGGHAGNDPQAALLGRAHARYEERLRANSACDFDDLLHLPVRLLRGDPGVGARWRGRFEHLLIDEYQDTNGAQHELVRLLVDAPWNVFAVGDEDQSIYRWRGARIGNMLEFEKSFPGARVLRLERNYRSTQTILAVANAVVRKNANRRDKTLWTEREAGERVVVAALPTEFEEGRFVSSIARRFVREGRKPGEIAILYRTNAQSRALEEGLRRDGVPYVIIGGIRFYERREVKDLLAYLRVIVNPRDDLAAARALGFPPRGVGKKGMERLGALAASRGVPLVDAFVSAEELEGVRGAAARAIAETGRLIARMRGRLAVEPAAAIARQIVTEVGFLEALEPEGPAEAAARRENVEELLAGMEAFAERALDSSLASFLAEVSLLTDVDAWEEREARVSLMTIHNAKGLEFPVVVIAGLEEGLFPHPLSSDGDEGLEEERRLFYVGLTRAMDRVVLTRARTRQRFGTRADAIASRFLREIPPEHREDRSVGPEPGVWSADRESGCASHAGGFGGRAAGAWRSRGGFGAAEDSQDDAAAWRAEPVYDENGREEGLRVGERVRHPLFGEGRVVQTAGAGASLKVTVDFGLGGTRKLVAAFAALERLA